MKAIFKLCLLILLLAPYLSSSEETIKQEKPDLGTCDEYTDYYIYKCKPFKCELKVGKENDITRSIETIGFEKDRCVHKYINRIQHPSFPPTEFKISCELSERGLLEMSALFTKYKKGDIEVYINPPYSEVLSQECNIY
jgi:hypothetical protein